MPSARTLDDRAVRLFIVLAAVFCANAVLAEFIGVKIFALEDTLGVAPLEWNLFGQTGSLSFTAGTLLWPFVFILTDTINEFFGKRGVRFISWLAVALIVYGFLFAFAAIALPLLEGLYSRVDSGKFRRELLFWQAESQAGLGRHRESAELYLRSATYGGQPGEDPWGHTARFQAARELASAGHPRDARDVFRRLLASTSDPHRRSVIERHIQQLWLIESQRQQP